jgi:hypothetical protein
VVCSISANPQAVIDLRVSLTKNLADYTTETVHPAEVVSLPRQRVEPNHKTTSTTTFVEWMVSAENLASVVIESAEASKLNQRQR